MRGGVWEGRVLMEADSVWVIPGAVGPSGLWDSRPTPQGGHSSAGRAGASAQGTLSVPMTRSLEVLSPSPSQTGSVF